MIVTDKNRSHGSPITPRQRADRHPASATEIRDSVRPDVLVRLPFLGADANHRVSQPMDYGDDNTEETRDFDQHEDKGVERRFSARSQGKRQRRDSAVASATESLRRWGYPLGGVAVAVILVVVVYRALTVGTDVEQQDAVPWNQDDLAVQIPGLNDDSTDALTSIPSLALSEADSASTAPFGQGGASTDPAFDPASPREYVATHAPSDSYDTTEHSGGHTADVPPGNSWNRTDEPSLNEGGELAESRPYWSAPPMSSDSSRDGAPRFDLTDPNPSTALHGPTVAPEKLPPPSSDQYGPTGDSTQPQPSSGGGMETTYPATPYPEADLSQFGGRPTPPGYDADRLRTARRPAAGGYAPDTNYAREYARGAARLEQRIEQVPARGYEYERN